MTRSTDLDAVKAFLEWASEKGLLLESVSCGAVSVTLRKPEPAPPVLIAAPLADSDEDDDAERDEQGFRMGPPRDSYAAYAREFGVSK